MSDHKDKNEITVHEKKSIEKEPHEPTRTGVSFSPSVDIFETEDALTLLADLPGVKKESLDIDLEDRKLTITGLVDTVDSRLRAVYSEYGIGGFTRSFELGDTINRKGISASLKDGVLTLVLPKADRLKPRKIDVAVN
jgi:HSP20 family protein